MSTHTDNVPVVYCFADLNTIKHAALFYDNVVPFPLEAMPRSSEPHFLTSQQTVNEIAKFIPMGTYNELLGSVYPFVSRPDEYGMAGHKFRAHLLVTLLAGQTLATAVLEGEELQPERGLPMLNFLKEFGGEPVVLLPEQSLRSDSAKADDVSITLGNMNLIDTSVASWEQIVAVRNDPEASKRLRNLRLFLQTNYTKRSKQFVEDDLARRLEGYSSVVKDYGFETFTSALTLITNSKNLVTFGTASLAALLFGEPILASASAATAVVLEVARVTLEVASKRHAFQKFKRDHDLSYIIDVRERLGADP